MKHFLTILYIAVIFGYITACSGKTEESTHIPKEITVYGSSECHHCVAFKAKLDSAGFQYVFKDLKIIERNYDQEMLMKVQQANYKGHIDLPVVEVGDSLMFRPSIGDVKSIL